MKNEHGITLLQVIVTIILIVILTGFSAWYASNTSTEAKLARIYAEISAVKDAYDNAKLLEEINPDANSLDNLLIEEEELLSEYGIEEVAFVETINETDELYLITPSYASYIELERISEDYVIDGHTGNVYLVGGFSRNNLGATVYEFKEIERLYRSTIN